MTPESVTEELVNRARSKYAEKEELFPDGTLREIERIVLLRNVDKHWIEHIDAMDDLEEAVGLRAYGQQDPIKVYRIESGVMFDEMNESIKEQTAKTLLSVVPANTIKHSEAPKVTGESRKQAPAATAAPAKRENVYGSAATPERKTSTPYVIYEGAIEPFSIQFSDVATKMLFSQTERERGTEVMATSNRLQYMSNTDKLNVSSQLLDRGILSINDVREIWNLPPVDGGDARIIRGEYYNADEKVTTTEEGNNGEA